MKIPIVLGGDWPWPSRSNLTWKSKVTPFWACRHDNSSPVQARITKFGPKVQNTWVKIPINFWIDWSWSSISFSILKPVFYQTYLRCFCKHLVRASLATDRLSWLLTYISFVVYHRWTFRSIINIAIDSIHIGRRIFSVNHSRARCLQLPSTSGSPRMRDTLPYVLAPVGFQNIKTPRSSAEIAGQNMGL